jgi:hypothetical protein
VLNIAGINSINIIDDISAVICGEAGFGIQTIEHALTTILESVGYNRMLLT